MMAITERTNTVSTQSTISSNNQDELSNKHLCRLLFENQSDCNEAENDGLATGDRLQLQLNAITGGQRKQTVSDLSISYGLCETQYGTVFIANTEQDICQLSFIGEQSKSVGLARLNKFWPDVNLAENQAATQQLVDIIFNSETPVSLNLLVTGTAFQIAVWQALLKIPQGEVWSYQQVAENVQRPSAVRAVANAIGANPIALLIPCHRVVRSDGGLGGYHWGLDVKHQLLATELNN